MRSLRNPQFNQPLAENQKEYETLYVNVNLQDPMCPVTACFELSLEEVEQITKAGKIYYQQCLFRYQDKEGNFYPGSQFQPMSIHVVNPIKESEVSDESR